MKVATATAWLGALMAVAGYAVYSGGVYTSHLLRIRRGEFGAQTDSGAIRVKPRNLVARFAIRDSRGSLRQLDFSGGNGIVLLYNDKCPACRDNMPRWLDLLAELRGAGAKVPVYALSTDSIPAQLAYWQDIESEVTVGQFIEPTAMYDNFGTTAIPSTVVVRNGRVTAIHTGAVGPWRRDFIMQAAIK